MAYWKGFRVLHLSLVVVVSGNVVVAMPMTACGNFWWSALFFLYLTGTQLPALRMRFYFANDDDDDSQWQHHCSTEVTEFRGCECDWEPFEFDDYL